MSSPAKPLWLGGLLVALCLVALVLVLAGIVWCTLRPTTLADRIAVLNLIVVAITAAVVAWYTVETRRLRQVTHRQALLQIRPFLSLRYSPAERTLRIHNIGKGVAREVQVQDVRLTREPDAENYLTVEWQAIDFIPEGEQRDLEGRRQVVTREGKQQLSDRLRAWMSNFGKHGSSEYEFVVDYRDLTGQGYRAAFEVVQGRTTLLQDAPHPWRDPLVMRDAAW